MSSARNHAKRSHRSAHAMRSAIGSSARKMYIKQAQKPKRSSFFKAVINRLRNREPADRIG